MQTHLFPETSAFYLPNTIPSPNYLLNMPYIVITVWSCVDTAVNRNRYGPCPPGIYILLGNTRNSYLNQHMRSLQIISLKLIKLGKKRKRMEMRR